MWVDVCKFGHFSSYEKKQFIQWIKRPKKKTNENDMRYEKEKRQTYMMRKRKKRRKKKAIVLIYK